MASAAYGPLERVLHRLALGSPAAAAMSFDIDQRLARADPERVTTGRHVFVSGLARAGTTILVRRLHATGVFRSLTYRDMPFVLAPNLWRMLRMDGRRATEATERAHGDGIRIDMDSPECLDEVFWRVFHGSDYIHETHLTPHEATEDDIRAYRAYVAAILASDGRYGRKSRYLSKNNNNVLRLSSILRAFPNARILVPFRDPLAHAESLLRQHRRFCRLQTGDGFIRAYMRWLAHHEFGLGHRPFWFDVSRGFVPSRHPPDALDYWVELWCRTYGWVIEHRDPRIVPVSYDRLCASVEEWRRVTLAVDVPDLPEGVEVLERREQRRPGRVGAELRDSAYALHERLLQWADCTP